MPRIEKLHQNTVEWSSWRLGGIGASDAPIVMGDSRWMSAQTLWEIKTRKSPEPDRHNLAVHRGRSLEGSARRAYEAATNEVMEPHCLTHDHLHWMHASLDGLNFDRSLVLEIKCPLRSADHAAAATKGAVPLHYYAQLQHQLEVSGARELHYWSFDGRRGALVRVFPDSGYIEGLVQAEIEFWRRVTENRWPEPRFKKRDLSDDPIRVEAARRYREVRERSDELEQQQRQLRGQLMSWADAEWAFGGGIELVRSTRKGAVDYRAVPELKGIDLERYRKPPVEVVKINLLAG
jgi:putative phage-type endonuclease